MNINFLKFLESEELELWREFMPNVLVSNFGRIYRKSFVDVAGNLRKGKFLKLIPDNKGYLRTTFKVDQKPRNFKVHKMVSKCWLEKSNLQVHHVDEDKHNNSASNLQYITTSDHADVHNSEKHLFVNPKGKIVEIFNLSKFCRENNLSQGNMWSVENGTRKSHKGWKRP